MTTGFANATVQRKTTGAESTAPLGDTLGDPLAGQQLAGDTLPDDGMTAAEEDPNAVIDAKTDTPGTLYSNTSKTDLNKKSDWAKRLGFELGHQYTAVVTLKDLILAGRKIKAPAGTDDGLVVGPSTTARQEKDYIIHGGGAQIVETVNKGDSASMEFPLRGGKGVGAPITLTFANNGALNLARLARAAYELAVAKGATITSDDVDYNGKIFALTCKIRMNNHVDEEQARSYGYVGEFELKWIQEKVTSTILAICTNMLVANQKMMRKHGDNGLIHPNARNTEGSQTSGGAGRENAIDSTKFGGKVATWTGDAQKQWITDPATLAGVANSRIRGAWSPIQKDWAAHPTYITDCPDMTDLITACFTACRGVIQPSDPVSGYKTYYNGVAPFILTAVRSIGARLQTAPMDHALIENPAQEKKLADANRVVMANAFKTGATTAAVVAALESMRAERKDPEVQPGDPPVQDDDPNGEGLVVLRDWSKVDNAP